jgi:hypothetical protein
VKQLLEILQSNNEMPTSTMKKTNLSTIGISDAACMKETKKTTVTSKPSST